METKQKTVIAGWFGSPTGKPEYVAQTITKNGGDAIAVRADAIKADIARSALHAFSPWIAKDKPEQYFRLIPFEPREIG